MDTKTAFRIAGLIVKKVLGQLSKEEETELMIWRSSPTNKNIYNTILSEKEFLKREEKAQNINVKKEWSRFKRKTTSHKKREPFVLYSILRYAAAIIIPLGIAGGIWFFVQKGVPVDKPVEEVIPPGGNNAVLTLADGTTLVLDRLQTGNIAKQENTDIIKLEDGKLVYNDSAATQIQGYKDTRPQDNILATPRGGEYQLTLSDGTKVHLNAMATLKYPVAFRGDARMVELSGQAYFEVSKDADHPFYVKLNDYTIKVLGTSFDVNSYNNDQSVITTLIEGSVEISSVKGISGEKYMLKPGQQFSFNKLSRKADIKDVKTSLYTRWANGWFSFDEENLENIFKILERWYEIDVFFADEKAKHEIFSGELPRFDDMNTILKMMEHVSKVRFKVDGSTIQIFKDSSYE
jgi:ferric-dicitrate binding protein FerR (iron transport regulator)